jgi:predicted esterase
MKSMKTLYARTLGIAFVVLITPLSAVAAQADQPNPFQTGAIIERVTCRADASQSYALFLPSRYTPQKRWPIIYCFDPGARGHVPLERFKEAAEKYGVIVAGSNSSRNGSSDVATAVNAMMKDTGERLMIDPRRVYTAGFSGGGRVATSVALSLGDAIAGVIACGGGFPSSVTPSKSVTFALFATAGTDDFNYPEMRNLTRAFDKLGLAYRFATFAGGHDWLTPALADEALAWLELQATKAGRCGRDEAFVNALFVQNMNRAEADAKAGNSYDAYLRYSSAARDFKGLRDTSAAEQRAAELRDDKAVKQAIKQEEEQERGQQTRIQELFTLKESLKSNDARPLVYADLQKRFADLKKKSDAPQPSSERTVARRVVNQFFVHLSEEANMLSQRKQYAAAAEDLALLALIAPDNPRVHYNLACAYALNRDRSRAIESLRRAVEKGFKDAAAIERNKDLDVLRDDPVYKQIVEELKNSKQ